MILDTLVKFKSLAPQSELQKPASRPFTFFPRTQAGIFVDEETALKYSAVWSAVRIISETMASLPWSHLKNRPNGGKEKLSDSNVSHVLGKMTNPETCAFTFRETIVAHGLLWGNGYAEIERDLRGKLKALWIIPPNRVNVTRDEDNNLVYEIVNIDQPNTVLPANRIFHLKGLGYDGLVGYSVIALAAQSIGLGLATEQYGASFFGSGSIPGGVLTHPGKLSDPAKDNLRDAWNKHHRGANKGGAIAVLEEGLKYESLGIPPDDAQFLETRKFQVAEIARWFRVPPHKIGDLENATFSNIWQQNIQFVTDAVVPWALRLEQEADAKLLSANRVSGTFTKLNVNGLLRGDTASRFDAYTKGRQWGWLSADDVREFEDMNPLPNGEGKIYLVPMNMTTPEKMLEPDPEPVPPALPEPEENEEEQEEDTKPVDKEKISASKTSYKYIFQECIMRILKRENHRVNDLNERVGGDKDKFIDGLNVFYKEHSSYMREQLSASIKSLLSACVGEKGNKVRDGLMDMTVNFYISKHIEVSKGEIMAAYDDGDVKRWMEFIRIDEAADRLIDKVIDAGLLAECLK